MIHTHRVHIQSSTGFCVDSRSSRELFHQCKKT